jgi:hypothetical protein
MAMRIFAATQQADLNDEEHGEVSEQRALELIHAFDWPGQRRYFDELAQAGKEYCPPGVILRVGEKGESIFHIMAGPGEGFELHLDLARDDKLLGFIPKPSHEIHVNLDDLAEVDPLVSLFFQDDRAHLLSQAQQKTPA